MKDVYNTLDTWLTDLDIARTDTIALLNTLEEISMNHLVESALLCHLRFKPKKGSFRIR